MEVHAIAASNEADFDEAIMNFFAPLCKDFTIVSFTAVTIDVLDAKIAQPAGKRPD